MKLDIKGKCILTAIFVYLIPFCGIAQEIIPRIEMLARPSRDSISLRWAPNNAASWQLLNKHGYLIARYTVLKEGRLLEKPLAKMLTEKPIKPRPVEEWGPYMNNRYAAVAAQAIYGADFQVSTQQKDALGRLINKVKENEARFSFALFSADQSFKVATLMGLSFVDTTADATENYLYRVYPAVPPSTVKIDTGVIFTGFSKYTPLPKPIDLQLETLEKGVMVSWSHEAFSAIYTSYWLERSDDEGRNFQPVTDAPLVNPSSGDPVKRMNKMDTISILGKRLIYRVKGITPFGETGPASDTVGISIFPVLRAVPTILKAEALSDSVLLTWHIEPEPLVLGFEVERSDNPKDNFVRINGGAVSAQTFRFIDPRPLAANYYRIRALSKNGSTASFPVFVQLLDSIPPVAPSGLHGVVSKTGVVSLSWKENTEKDLFGYRVFRANRTDEDFVQVTRKPTTRGIYSDTLETQSLTRKIYYKVVAVDRHFNPSAFSVVLELDRPDVIPPVSPSFTEVISTPQGVRLAWNTSTSDDVTLHELHRSEAGAGNWMVVKSFGDSTSSYFDSLKTVGKRYSYRLRATDTRGHFSDSRPISAQAVELGLKPRISAAKAVPDRPKHQILINWNYNLPKVQAFLLYRKEGEGALRLYRTLGGNQFRYEDKELFINSIYQYRLKALFEDGTETPFSDALKVKY